MKISVIIILLISFLLFDYINEGFCENSCPQSNERATQMLNSAFAEDSPRKASLKERFGIDIGSAQIITPLTDTNHQDKLICKQLNEKYEYPDPDRPELKRAYFKTDQYFISIQYIESVIKDDGSILMSSGYNVLRIFDKDLNVVGAMLL